MRCQNFLLVCLLSLLSGAPYTQVRAQNSSRNHREGTGNNQSGTKSDTDTSHSTASSSREKISTSSTGSSSSSNGADGFDVYQSKIEFAKKQKEGRKAIEQTLRSSSTEHCDWRVTPLQFLKGQYCGKHYKIFGLNRHMNESSKEIKKRYRKLSLLLHPDKNPGREAPRAFSILTDGYNCLMNKECKDSYDKQLHSLESDEAIRREALLNRAKELSKQILERLHFHISRIAASIEQTRISIWNQFEDVEILDLPVGKLGMIMALLVFRNPLIYLLGFSRGVLTLNAYLHDRQYHRNLY